MKIAPGWYRIASGERAYVAAVAPDSAPLTMEDCYAIGWIIDDDTGEYLAQSWSMNGTCIDVPESNIVRSELATSTPDHQQN
jgi:hypothetical protein